MSTFTSLLGKRVEVSYRAGEAQMIATGTLAIDSGRYIRLEDRFSVAGREKTLCVEIPYSAVLRVRELVLQPE